MAGPVQDEFERAIARALERNHVATDAAIIAGVSGGPDSVALLRGLLALRAGGTHYRVIAAHLNHGLRGAEADRDEAFVRALCERTCTEFVIGREEGLDPSTGNLEERARICRHAFLNRIADHYGADYIALAHHSGDQAETVLLRLMRGCGIAGASGMAEAGPGRLLRPLLGVTRDEIIRYLDALGQDYVTDGSNLGTLNSRGRVRNELIPLMERDYAPGLRRRLNEFARELRSADNFLMASAEAELANRLANRGGSLDITGFAELHPALAAALLREYLRVRRGDLRRVNRAHIESMRSLCVKGPANGWCDLPGGWRMRRQYNIAIIEPASSVSVAEFEVRLDPRTPAPVFAGGFAFVTSTISVNGAFFAADSPRLRVGPMEALFDQDCGIEHLTIRNFRSGDRIRPFGMDGSRKVHDLFIDRKLPPERRRSWPLVATNDGEILWIPGMARSRIAPVTAVSRKVLNLTAELCAPGSDRALPRI